ncbi:hypothetical protein AWB65_06825 [Caballeronia humi]|uniref:Uncharacterized protein n=1 Tax=Caballeronia humi TaxID=326474 RepID=A0A158JLQ8_9BURK|nr:hypothetical protein AWB65_06825 [Caballeronia humi]
MESKKVVISSRLRTTGSLNGFFGSGKILVAPVTFERHPVEETQCADRCAETGGRQLAFFAEVDELGADLLGT